MIQKRLSGNSFMEWEAGLVTAKWKTKGRYMSVLAVALCYIHIVC
jgi:hypothetical protein